MSKSFKILMIAVIGIVLVSVAFVMYRMFFQFDSADIRVYVKEESEKYADKVGAYNMIMYGVQDILRSGPKTRQVLLSAASTKTDVEQELVNAAVNQCKALRYFPS